MSRTLIPIREAKIAHAEVAGNGRNIALASNPTQAFAIYVRPVNLLRQPCTCLAQGTCPTCQAWAATRRRHEAMMRYAGC